MQRPQLLACMTLAFSVATLSGATSVSAQTSLQPPVIGEFGDPQFVRRPTVEQLANVYPSRALRLGISGHAQMDCMETDAGDVERCVDVYEDPSDQGFGDAALKLAHLFRVGLSVRGNPPRAGQHVIISIRFDHRMAAGD